MPVTPDVAHHRARYANACLRGDPEIIADTRRDLAAASLEAAIRRIVDNAPEFSPEQRERLAALLFNGS